MASSSNSLQRASWPAAVVSNSLSSSQQLAHQHSQPYRVHYQGESVHTAEKTAVMIQLHNARKKAERTLRHLLVIARS
jgi:hypothetical protein